ncbi:MAG: peptidase S1 [Bacteroidota bacterium]
MPRLLLLALALLLVPTTLQAQDVGGSPTYGDLQLEEGFQPDPNSTSLTAGGSIEVNKGACTYGFVAEAPDVDLYYSTSGDSPLYIYVESEGDVTLLVSKPDASWVCDDDSFGNSDPILVIPNAPDGLYNIWIGTYGDEMQSATLHVSEIDPR